MKFEQNPFSVYDFLGYLIPGLLFSYGTLFIIQMNVCDPYHIPKLDLQMDDYFIVIILSYLIGHILSYLSSVSIELYSIWTLGYPSRYLLNLDFPGFWRNVFKENNCLKVFLKLCMVLYIYPVIICDVIVRKIFKIKNLLGKPIDIIISNLIRNKVDNYCIGCFSQKETEKIQKSDTADFFNFIYHYTLEKYPTHVSKLNNYVSLYGFTRTLCFSFITLSWIIIIRGFGGEFSWSATSIILVISVISGILYLDFNKFYRKYSNEVLLAFVSNYKNS